MTHKKIAFLFGSLGLAMFFYGFMVKLPVSSEFITQQTFASHFRFSYQLKIILISFSVFYIFSAIVLFKDQIKGNCLVAVFSLYYFGYYVWISLMVVAPPLRHPLTILAILSLMLLIWVLFESDNNGIAVATLKRILIIYSILGLGLLAMDFVMLYRAKMPRQYPKVEVIKSEMETLPDDYVLRNIGKYQIALPKQVHVLSYDLKDSLTVMMTTPEENALIFLSDLSVGDALKQGGMPYFGFSCFELHQRFLSPGLSVTMSIMRALSLPSGRIINLSIFKNKSKGMVKSCFKRHNVFFTDYSIYPHSRPKGFSVSLLLGENQFYKEIKKIDESMTFSDAMSDGLSAAGFYQKAQEAIGRQNWNEAQFDLLSYFLLGGDDLTVHKEFLKVSAQIGAWKTVDVYATRILSRFPDDAELKSFDAEAKKKQSEMTVNASSIFELMKSDESAASKQI